MDELYIVPRHLAQFKPLPEPLKHAVEIAVANSGLTTSQLLQLLSDNELEQLVANTMLARVDKATLTAMSLFSVLLANSEGLVVLATDNISTFVSKLCLYVQAEIWARKGYVAVNYSMVTLEDFNSSCMTVTKKGRIAGAKIVITSSDSKKPNPPASGQ